MQAIYKHIVRQLPDGATVGILQDLFPGLWDEDGESGGFLLARNGARYYDVPLVPGDFLGDIVITDDDVRPPATTPEEKIRATSLVIGMLYTDETPRLPEYLRACYIAGVDPLPLMRECGVCAQFVRGNPDDFPPDAAVVQVLPGSASQHAGYVLIIDGGAQSRQRN